MDTAELNARGRESEIIHSFSSIERPICTEDKKEGEHNKIGRKLLSYFSKYMLHDIGNW